MNKLKNLFSRKKDKPQKTKKQKKIKKVDLNKKVSLKQFLLSSALIDIFMAVIIFVGCIAIGVNFNNTNKKVEDNTNHISQLEQRLDKIELEVETLGYFITTSVGDDGEAYIEINGLRDSKGNVVDFDEYVSASEFQEAYNKIDECLAHQLTDYNYVQTLNSSEKVVYSIWENGIAIDGLIADKGTLTFLEVPETVNGMEVTAIGASCFSGSTLSAVKLPKSISTIGYCAFAYCSNLISVEFYSTDETKGYAENVEIGSYAFAGCSVLETITLPDTLKHIRDYTFENCYMLSDVVLPSGLLSLGVSAFDECYALKELVLPNTLTLIDSYAFAYCNIQEFNVPNSVEIIGRNAFVGNVKHIELPSSFEVIDTSYLGLSSSCEITYRNV